jgi:hypothetical protein
MTTRIVQISCLLVLGLLASSLRVDARRDDPCMGKHCTDCWDPEPSGNLCWVGPGGGIAETCQYYGCDAVYVCGETEECAQCVCEPCPPR